MKVITLNDVLKKDREVLCPNKNFISNRYLLEEDGMGYTITKTVIPKGTVAEWHYKKHLESCFCVSGSGAIKDCETGEIYPIVEDSLYALDRNDRHQFAAFDEVVLICVFNPPLKGKEVHGKDNSYE